MDGFGRNYQSVFAKKVKRYHFFACNEDLNSQSSVVLGNASYDKSVSISVADIIFAQFKEVTVLSVAQRGAC